MIIVYGNISNELTVTVSDLDHESSLMKAKSLSNLASGRGANQALAAARTGAKTVLVGCAGDDETTAAALDDIRQDGVLTSGVSKTSTPTGTFIHIQDEKGNSRRITYQGANAKIDIDQIPDEILRSGSVLLLQSEVNVDQNIALLKRAKEHDVLTIMNMAPDITIQQDILENLDYLIINQEQAIDLAKELKVSALDHIPQMAHALATQGNLTCVITNGKEGCISMNINGEGFACDALELEEVVDKAGAEDVFAGTFTAAIHAGIDLSNSLKRASIAATLTCMKKGVQASFPYSDEIEEQLSNLKDPEVISAKK